MSAASIRESTDHSSGNHQEMRCPLWVRSGHSDRLCSSGGIRSESGRSLLGQGPDCTQLIRIKPYSAAGRALVYHDQLLGAEASSHHCDIRIPWTLQSRRCSDQQAVTRYEIVEQNLSEKLVRFVDHAQLESIEPDSRTAMTNVRLKGPNPNSRETMSTSWALHLLVTLPRVDRKNLSARTVRPTPVFRGQPGPRAFRRINGSQQPRDATLNCPRWAVQTRF